jgi:oligopeptide transport system permease protein
MASEATSPALKRDLAYYSAMYQEAHALRGVSLWQDAWRRLRKNRVAMVSLGILFMLVMLALLTPALPLQSPRLQNVRERQFEPPTYFEPRRLELVGQNNERHSLSELLAQYHAERTAAAQGDAAQTSATTNTTHPFELFWHRPGPVTRMLLHTRMMLFGDWCLPSLCGTDLLGRDLLARIFWGARVSLMVGFVAASVSLVIGVSYGATAGYLGGWIDAAMMRLVDTLYSIPFLFVVIFIITVLGEDSRKEFLEQLGIARITIFYLVIGLIYWLTMARVVRGQVVSLRHEPFIDAARVLGVSTIEIVARHLVPNVAGVVIVYLTLTIPSVMLFEAALSYLGLGVEPPDVSWGMLVDEGMKVITPVRTYWWLVAWPGAVLSVTLFALNFLGDGLRDALDPRLKNR